MTTHALGPASPPAARLRRPGWRDTRFLVGIGLVAASVAVGATAFSAAARTVPVYAASGPLVPGDPLTTEGLIVQEVRLGGSAESYLRADQPFPDGLVVTRTVASGELVPVSATAPAADLGLRPVAITPRGTLSSGVLEGGTVDLWFVPDVDDRGTRVVDAAAADAAAVPGAAEAGGILPVQLASGLIVAEVSEPSGSFSVGSSITVHVLVPVDELPAVLAALAADGAVEIVPVPGPRR